MFYAGIQALEDKIRRLKAERNEAADRVVQAQQQVAEYQATVAMYDNALVECNNGLTLLKNSEGIVDETTTSGAQVQEPQYMPMPAQPRHSWAPSKPPPPPMPWQSWPRLSKEVVDLDALDKEIEALLK